MGKLNWAKWDKAALNGICRRKGLHVSWSSRISNSGDCFLLIQSRITHQGSFLVFVLAVWSHFISVRTKWETICAWRWSWEIESKGSSRTEQELLIWEYMWIPESTYAAVFLANFQKSQRIMSIHWIYPFTSPWNFLSASSSRVEPHGK